MVSSPAIGAVRLDLVFSWKIKQHDRSVYTAITYVYICVFPLLVSCLECFLFFRVFEIFSSVILAERLRGDIYGRERVQSRLKRKIFLSVNFDNVDVRLK